MSTRLSKMFLAMALAFPFFTVGCGGDAGVDATSIEGESPKRENFPSRQENIEKFTNRLKRDGSDFEVTPGKRIRFIRFLMHVAPDSEPSLPVLEDLAANDEDADVRAQAQEAIDKIKAAVAEK